MGVVTAKLKELVKFPPHTERNGLPGTISNNTIHNMMASRVSVIATATKQPMRMLLDLPATGALGAGASV